MAETVRSIKLRLEVDTTKRTEVYEAECDSLEDAEARLSEWVEEWS